MLSEKPWRLIDFLLIASPILGILLLSLITSVGPKPEPAPAAESDPLINFVFTLIIYGITVLLIQLILTANNIKWTEAFGLKSSALGRDLLMAIGVTVVVLPVAWFLNDVSTRLMTRVHLTPQVQKPVQMLRESPSVVTTLCLSLTAVVIAPFVEEVVFRGIFYPYIKQRWRRWTALLVTSICFGAMHMNLPTFVPLVFLGLALAWLYERTGNLLAPILAHSLFNLVNLLGLAMARAW